jgi:uncharacterized protein
VTLLGDVAGLEVFDRVFNTWFLLERHPSPPVDESDVAAPGGDGRDLPSSDPREGGGTSASSLSVRSRRRFDGAGSPDLARTLRAAFAAARPTVPSRRRRPSPTGRRLDMRRTLRRARRTHGEIVDLCWSTRPRRPRRMLILLDVSGSLKEHTPALLRVAHAAAGASSFAFGTRLTRITRELAVADPQRALSAVSRILTDADGGTAIGHALQEFLGNPRHLALARGALIVVISDGLERGDCTPMVRAVERLARLGHRLIWWSPLACAPSYRPVTRGMAALLGHLDRLGGVRDERSALAEVRRIPSVTAGPRRTAWRHWT